MWHEAVEQQGIRHEAVKQQGIRHEAVEQQGIRHEAVCEQVIALHMHGATEKQENELSIPWTKRFVSYD